MTRVPPKAKWIATWLAVLGGGLGAHRLYLYGKRDGWAWWHAVSAVVGLYGVWRMRQWGQDDQMAWILIPWLGITLSVGMLAAVIFGLTPDEAWSKRYHPEHAGRASGWLEVIGVVLALAIGATALMATIAFSAQRYFEYQADMQR